MYIGEPMFSTWCPDLSLNFDAQILYDYIARGRLSVGKRAKKGGGGKGPGGGGRRLKPTDV
jgi:hypothetical protein